MIPGGFEGLRQMHRLGISTPNETTPPDDRESRLESYAASGARKGLPNKLIAQKWDDDDYAEAVICGNANRLAACDVRRIRWLAITGNSVETIAAAINASSLEQVRNVLRGKTYSRIK